MDANADQQRFEALFNQLIASLNEAAMVQMGLQADPDTGKIERNLSLVRNTIDLLRMLKAKTRNNLTESENRMLDQSLVKLQMNYVYAANPKSEAEKMPEKNPDQPTETETNDEKGTGAKADKDLLPGSRPGENN